MSVRSTLRSLLVLCIAWPLLTLAQPAEEPAAPPDQSVVSPTLDKIGRDGIVFLGHREAATPFSFLLDDKPAGFAVELCERVIDGIRTYLNRPDLRVVPIPMSAVSRFMGVMTATTDMECGVTTNTKIRQARVDFSVTFFVANLKILVRKNSGIKTLNDLDGKAVVTTTNTTAARIVGNAAAQRKFRVKPLTGRSTADTMSLFTTGKADAVAMDDILIAGQMAGLPNSDDFVMLEDKLSWEPYGIILPKGDPVYKKVVDDALRVMMASGEFERLYNKWFMEPIPPKGNNLQWPLGDQLREMIANPDDKGA
jgi:glutamate/aspartate transport system substrate-binding protein